MNRISMIVIIAIVPMVAACAVPINIAGYSDDLGEAFSGSGHGGPTSAYHIKGENSGILCEATGGATSFTTGAETVTCNDGRKGRTQTYMFNGSLWKGTLTLDDGTTVTLYFDSSASTINSYLNDFRAKATQQKKTPAASQLVAQSQPRPDAELDRLKQETALTKQRAELEYQKAELEKRKREAELAKVMEAESAQVASPSFPEEPVKVSYTRVPARPDDIAVIIGNADYKKQGRDIPNVIPAYADAEGIRRYVTQALGIADDNIIFIKDATQKDMVGTFGSERDYKGRLFRYLTKERSRVFVFYSGHGAPGDGDTNFLVPTDAEASLINLNGFSLKTLYQNLSKLPAKSVTVVLEACFSGASEAGTVINNASPVYLKAKDTGIPPNITVIAAGAANQIASWEQDKSHGLFTKYFLKGMSGEADNDNDSKVSWDELRGYLAETVTRSAMRNYGREQTPQIVVGKAN